MTVVAIHQPNYLPWLGYFAKLAAADVFIVLDDAQLPGGSSYVNRVKIAGRGEAISLTIPTARNHGQPIKDAQTAGTKWIKKHRGTLQARYGKTPFYKQTMALLGPIFDTKTTSLSELNTALIKAIAEHLELRPKFVVASEIDVDATSTERLVELIKAVNGSVYISGQGGTNYQDPALFEAAGIDLRVRKYTPIPYSQMNSDDFVAGLSIVDALFNLGQDTRELLVYPGQLPVKVERE